MTIIIKYIRICFTSDSLLGQTFWHQEVTGCTKGIRGEIPVKHWGESRYKCREPSVGSAVLILVKGEEEGRIGTDFLSTYSTAQF